MNIWPMMVSATVLFGSSNDGASERRPATRLVTPSVLTTHMIVTEPRTVQRLWSNGPARSRQAVGDDGGDLVVILLLDLTASMRRFTYKSRGTIYRNNDTALPNSPTLKSNELRQLVDRFADAVRPGERFTVNTFTDHVERVTDFTSDRRQLRASGRARLDLPEKDIARYGPSPIWDAVDVAVGTLKPLSGRRGVVLVTDGRASGNHLSINEVARHAVDAGVIVDVISVQPDYDLRQADGSTITVRPSVFLQRLAETSGGTFLVHRDRDPVSRQLDEILTHLRR